MATRGSSCCSSRSLLAIFLYLVLLAFGILLLLAAFPCGYVAGQVTPGSRLLASEAKAWVSENGTFAFGFTSIDPSNQDQLTLGIWFAQIPRDQRAVVWSANRDTPVGKGAVLEFDTTGNLVLLDSRRSAVWTSNSTSASSRSAKTAVLAETGNLILYDSDHQPIWQSFSHPIDTLLPGQPLTVSMRLISAAANSSGYYYALKMLQQPTSLSLALSYHKPGSSSNYSYWQGPEISNVKGEMVAVLDDEGSFGIVYGDQSSGAVYVYKNSRNDSGLSSAVNQTVAPSVFRRLTLEPSGNLRLYRWCDNLNGPSQWVSRWAAVSNPCDIAGTCRNGICNLDRTMTNSLCTCLPGRSKSPAVDDSNTTQCAESSTLAGKCSPENLTSQFKISSVHQTNYHFTRLSVIKNYSNIGNVSACGSRCLSDCECVASVYGLSQGKPCCWVLRSLDFGGFQDPSSTLFVKVLANASDGVSGGGYGSSSLDSRSGRAKAAVLPIVLSMGALIGLLCLLLYYGVHRGLHLQIAVESSLIFSGAPISFIYRDLQLRTANFSELLGIGGFGGVYKGRLGDGTLIAVKKLDRILPRGEKEFITEVNTIGSMHHMNLVRLCGYCSEGQHRLLVYEFMKNGSLDKWIFPSNHNPDNKFLDWPTRYSVALGTARGIAYFHEQCRDRVIHCDIKPENILLDENFGPKVSDFGLAKLIGRDHSRVVTMVRGTRGYLAPEWISNRPVTVKADVYSYGMLLLEIIGGRRNLDMSLGPDDFFFPGRAFKEMTSGIPKKAVDKRLEGAAEEEEVSRALRVGFWCIQDEVSARPSMGEVVKMLEGSWVEINMPPMPQLVLELIEEGLDQVYRAMRGEFSHRSSSVTVNSHCSSWSRATCSYSTMSPR